MAPKTSDTPNKSGKAHHGSAARVKAQHPHSASLNQSGHSSVAGLHASHASTSSALGTPGRKSDLYAGPTFHHSPAPAKLPPPPFLSSSVPGAESSLPAARSLLSFPGVGGPAGHAQGSAEQLVDASPLGFLFRAKEREEQRHSVHGSMSGGNMLDLLFQPPSAPVQQQQQQQLTRFGAHSPTQSMDYTTDDESVFADFASPIVPSSAQFRPDPGALGGVTASTQTVNAAAIKKPAWQPIERPPTVSLSQIQQEPENSFAPPPGSSGVPRATRARQSGATESSQPRKQAAGSQHEKTVRVRKQDKHEGGKDTTKTAPNMTASTSRRRKKEVNGAPASPAAPKAILKREPAAGEASTSVAGAPMRAMQQPGAAQGSVKTSRQSSASEFKLLKKPTAPSAQTKTVLLKHAKRDSKSASPVPLATASGSFTLPDENELDDAALLQDASALVKLLSLNPAAESDRPLTPLSQPAALQQSVIGTPRDNHVAASGSPTTTDDAISMTTPEDGDGQSQADQQAESALQRMLGLSATTTTTTNTTHTHTQASSRLASPGQISPKQVKQAGQADTSALEMDLRKLLQLSA